MQRISSEIIRYTLGSSVGTQPKYIDGEWWYKQR